MLGTSVQTGGASAGDLLVGVQLRLNDGEDHGTYREGVVTKVSRGADGVWRILLAVNRRVICDVEMERFEEFWEFDDEVPMRRLEVDWNGWGLSRRTAVEVVHEPVAEHA